jgi:O-antigen/teichoic acid export membrane protein
MSVLSRIGAALAANAFGQAVTVASQLLLTPLYFRYWGVELYGEWLLLSSIPAYLMMADMGIGSAAANEMVMRAGGGDRRGAQATFYGALWVAAVASGLVMGLGLLAAAASGLWQWPATPHITSMDAALIILLLAAGVAMGFAGSVLGAGFRSCERNALGISVSNGGRLLEVVVIGVLLVGGCAPLRVCVAIIVARLSMLVLQLLWLRQVGGWLFAPGVVVDRHLVRRLARPAIGFMAFPLGNALVLQGPLLILGATLGGAAVAMFSSLRTLARIPMQVTNMFNTSIWPELSRAHGAGDLALLRRLHRLSWVANLTVLLPLAAGQLLLGRWVVLHWLGPTAPYDAWVFGALVLSTGLTALWGASSIVLVATNLHLRLGAVYVIGNALNLTLAALLTTHFGWAGMFAPLVLTEVLLLAWLLPSVIRTTGDRASSFFRSLPGVGFELLGRLHQRLR